MTPSDGKPRNAGAASMVNLWLAIGDETGEFKNYAVFEPAWCRADSRAPGHSRCRAGRNPSTAKRFAVEWTRRWRGSYRTGCLPKVRRSSRNSVGTMCARRGFTCVTTASLANILSMPRHRMRFWRNLLAAFRWLAGHPGIVSLGIHGSGKEVMGDFATGSDRMAVLGTLYGQMLALVKPFLGASPRIRMLPGRRSEEIDDASHPACRTTGPGAFRRYYAADDQQDRWQSRVAGRDRATVLANPRQHGEWWPVPPSASARQILFAGYMSREALVTALEREDQQAANLVRGEETD